MLKSTLLTFCLAQILATFVCTQNLYASQSAQVLVDKAEVYADQHMQSPIGYIARGKKILVGDKKRNKGRVYPTVVNGKVVYIRVLDIQTENQYVFEKKPEDKLKRKIELVKSSWFEVRYNHSPSEVTNPAESNSSIENFTFSGWGVRGHIVEGVSRTNKRISFDYLEGKKDNATLRLYDLELEYAFSIIRLGSSRLNTYAGINLIPHAQIRQGGLYTKNGYGAGASVGAELAIGFNQNVHLHLDGKYSYKKLAGFSLPKEVDMDFSPVIAGAQFSAGLSYSY